MNKDEETITSETVPKQTGFYWGTLIVTTLICLLPIVAGIILWDKLPDQIASHFDRDGNPNGWSSRAFIVYGMPLMMCAFNLIMWFPFNSKKQHINTALRLIMSYFMPVICIYVHATIYAKVLNYSFNAADAVGPLIAFVFILLGNFLPKAPVELINIEVNLPAAHMTSENIASVKKMAVRHVGLLMVIAGVLLLAVWFTPFRIPGLFIITAVFVILTFVIITADNRRFRRDHNIL